MTIEAQSYTLKWERIASLDLLYNFRPPHCYGCGEYLQEGEYCATLRMAAESPLRFHKDCLGQITLLFSSFLDAIEQEGKPN